MKPRPILEKCYSAGRVEALLLGASAMSGLATIFVFLNHGWALGVIGAGATMAIYAMSRLIDLATDALILLDRLEKGQSVKSAGANHPD